MPSSAFIEYPMVMSDGTTIMSDDQLIAYTVLHCGDEFRPIMEKLLFADRDKVEVKGDVLDSILENIQKSNLYADLALDLVKAVLNA